MKKILLLGGAKQQIPAIEYAKSKGYYTILCDYLEDNPGQYVADKFYLESTTDKECILDIAKRENVDGVVSYLSDPATPTVAYVSNKLGLQSHPYESVKVLSNKHLFRKFLKENNFNSPKAKEFMSFDSVLDDINYFRFPIMIKPVDCNGSRGVTRIDSSKELKEIELAFDLAMQLSRSKTIIIEEYIESDHDFVIDGEFFVIDGEIKFWGFMNSQRNRNINHFVPVGYTYPLDIDEERIIRLKEELKRVIDLLDIKLGAVNFEAVFTEDNKLYFIEIAPRNGGNSISEYLEIITGINLMKAQIECSMGNKDIDLSFESNDKYYSCHNLYSNTRGIFDSVEYSEKIKDNIIKEIMFKQKGDLVEPFNGLDKRVGVIFMEHNSKKSMDNINNNIEKYININIK